MAALLSESSDEQNVSPEIAIEVDAEGCTEVTGTAMVTVDYKDETQTRWEDRSPGGTVNRSITDLRSYANGSVRLVIEKTNSSYDKSTKTITHYYDVKDSSVQSFQVSGKNYYYGYHYDPDRECGCAKKETKGVVLRDKHLEQSGAMSVTFDAETGKAKYVALPFLAIVHDTEQTTTTSYEGCCGSEGGKNTQTLSNIPFTLGSAKAKGEEQLARELQKEASQMQQIALDSKKLAEEIMGSMGQLMTMNEEQSREFYENLEKKMEEFEKGHNIDELAQNVEKKVIPEDMIVQSEGGKNRISGGGTRIDSKQIDNGTTRWEYNLKWRINLNEKPGKNE